MWVEGNHPSRGEGGGGRKQSHFRNVDDSSFMVMGDKQCVDKLVRLHKAFSETSRMEL